MVMARRMGRRRRVASLALMAGGWVTAVANDLSKRQHELRQWAERHKSYVVALAGLIGAMIYFAPVGSWWHSKATAYAVAPPAPQGRKARGKGLK